MLHDILTKKPQNGLEAILIPYLVQKVYLAHKLTPNHLTPSWIIATEENYMRIFKIKEKVHIPNETIFKRLRDARISGLLQWESKRPNANTPDQSISYEENSIIVPFEEEDIQLEKPQIGSFTEKTVEHGLPIGKGPSGTTNLFLGTFAHLKHDLKLDINLHEALLGLILFVGHDGGHSIDEVIWTVHQRESVRDVSHEQLPYLHLGLEVAPSTTATSSRGRFISDYEHFIQSFKNNELTKETLNNALTKAWERTLHYADKDDILSGHFILERVVKKSIANLKTNPNIDITSYLDELLNNETGSDRFKSKLNTAIKLENIFNHQPNFYKKNEVITHLNKLIQLNTIQHSLLNTIKTHPKLTSTNKKHIQHLILHHYQHGYGANLVDTAALLNTFSHMLKHANDKLTSASLTALLCSYNNIPGSKLPDLQLLKTHLDTNRQTSSSILTNTNLTLTVAQQLITDYHHAITHAKTDKAKLTAIAKLTIKLSNCFTNETTKLIIRTVLTNQLLLQVNLSPTIITTNELNTLDLNTLVEAITKGQNVFKNPTIINEKTNQELSDPKDITDHDAVFNPVEDTRHKPTQNHLQQEFIKSTSRINHVIDADNSLHVALSELER